MPEKVKVRVFHSYYGCESGCCGHTVEITLPDGAKKEEFSFTHRYGEDSAPEAWGRKLAEEVVGREWPECLATIDWSTLEVDVGCDD